MIKKRVERFIKNPKKGLFILAGPFLISMLAQALYNIVDTAFVGRLGPEAIAALTFSFPLFFVLISLNSGISSGVGSRVARFLGELKKKDAENTVMHGLFVSLIIALIVFILGTLFLEPIFLLLGASGTVLELAMDYMSIIFIAVFFMFPIALFNYTFSAQGDSKTPLKIMLVYLILNITLDPIFIYVLGYGVKGAAMATAIAAFFGLLASIYYITKKSLLKVRLSSFNFSKRILKDILKVGVPISLMMLISSISYMFFNNYASTFGTNYVASIGLVQRLESFVILPLFALSASLMNLVGMFYGAKKYKILREISAYTIKIGLLFTFVIGLIFFLIPETLLRIFTSDPEILSIGSTYLRILVFGFPFIALINFASRIMQGLGYGFPGFMIVFTRAFLITIPLAYLFIFVFGFGFLSLAAAMVIGLVFAGIFGMFLLKLKLNRVLFKKLPA